MAFKVAGGFKLVWFLLGVMALVITSFVLFEQSIEQWISDSAAVIAQSDSNVVWLVSPFIVALLAFDILLPIPSSVVSVFAATSLGFTFGALSIWLGLMLGCAFGYFIGASSQHWFLRRWVGEKDYCKAHDMADRLGAGALVMMRGVPVLAETSVIAAGIVRYPLRKFLLITALANAGLALAFAYVGAQAGVKESFLLVLAGSIAVPAIAWSLKRVWQYFSDKPNEPAAAPAPNEEINQIEAAFKVDYQYPVIFQENVFEVSNPCLAKFLQPHGNASHQSVMIFVDQGVIDANSTLLDKIARYFDSLAPRTRLLTAPVAIVGGEAAKRQSEIEAMYQAMLHHKVDRHNVVIAIGGGAVLDAVGYACATFHRGVKLLRMPSTVLAQNDAGVGVKSGINAYQTKNLIGSFYPPMAVINDAALLTNLASRDKRAGLAEAVKVAAIRDKAYFEWLEDNAEALAAFETQASCYAIARCAELHLQQIARAGDPFESGSARPLDYGHWAAHKLEAMAGYTIRHGEAVAIGMVLDAYYAAEVGLLANDQAMRLSRLLEKLGFQLWHPALEQRSADGRPELFSGLEEFRQHLGGELCITLLESMGCGKEVSQIHNDELTIALQKLRHLHRADQLDEGSAQHASAFKRDTELAQ